MNDKLTERIAELAAMAGNAKAIIYSGSGWHVTNPDDAHKIILLGDGMLELLDALSAAIAALPAQPPAKSI